MLVKPGGGLVKSREGCPRGPAVPTPSSAPRTMTATITATSPTGRSPRDPASPVPDVDPEHSLGAAARAARDPANAVSGVGPPPAALPRTRRICHRFVPTSSTT